MRKLSGLLVLLFIASVSLGEAVRGLIPASFVLRSGDTMTGALIIDMNGRLALVLNGHQTINLDWDEMLPGSAGIEFTQSGTQDGEWFIKLPETAAPSAGIDSAFNWRTYELFPVLDNVYNSGGDLLRWKSVYSYDGNFKDDLTVLDLISGGSLQIGGVLDPYVNETGDTMTGTLLINPDSDLIGLQITPDWGLGSVAAIDISQSGGTYSPQDWFIKIYDVLGGAGEYDGMRSDGFWRFAWAQVGNGEIGIADGVSKTALAPGGIYAEINLDETNPYIWPGTFIDISNYTGSVAALDKFFNIGDGGGLLAKDITLTLLGVLTINNIEPVQDGVGNIGSTGGDAFNQMVAKDIRAEEHLSLPSDIDTYTGSGGTTEIELAVQDLPLPSEETLRIGNIIDGGYVDINARGEVLIKTDAPDDRPALTISRDGLLKTQFWESGQMTTTNISIQELRHFYGFTEFPGYEQTDEGDDVGYYTGIICPQKFGSVEKFSRIWLEFQTETNGSYISQVAVIQRDPNSLGILPLWSQATTLGQGDTLYHSTFIDVSPAGSASRLAEVRLTCTHSPSAWIRVSRVAVSTFLERY